MDAALNDIFLAQRAASRAHPFPAVAERRGWLTALHDALLAHEGSLCAAIDKDFGHRPDTETRLLELFPSLAALRHARRHLSRWMKPDARHVSWWFRPGRAVVRYQPLGVAGIVVPWNYPLFLAVGPLCAALAAGNRAMIKLSEHTPHFTQEFSALIAQIFPQDLVHVSGGDATAARHFVSLQFDHLLFTGSPAVGREVMASAAQHLTPVTLELGGKSPALIAPGCDLASTARRIMFGKLVNAGQTCIAPDYVLAPAAQVPALVEALRAAAQSMYGTAASPDYTSIANDRHYARLEGMLNEARQLGARVEPLLDLPPTTLPRRFAPVVVLDATVGMQVLREEIFGPILPIVGYAALEDAIGFIDARDRPLAMYVFDRDVSRREHLLARTASGGVTINDTLLHLSQSDLPFGGVGGSGMGRYHAIEGFRTFSQVRSVYRQSDFALTSLMYPPYGRAAASRLLSLMVRRGRQRA